MLNDKIEFRVWKGSRRWITFPWTRVRKSLLLRSGAVVDRYELGPLTMAHVGVGGALDIDVGRRFVLDVSVNNKNWSQVGYIVDEPR